MTQIVLGVLQLVILTAIVVLQVRIKRAEDRRYELEADIREVLFELRNTTLDVLSHFETSHRAEES